MASKPGLHKHFVHEPEISTIRNCLANPVDKGKDNELTRFMIKLVCNLTKNPEVIPNLLSKGFLEILFDLLKNEREKEIFGTSNSNPRNRLENNHHCSHQHAFQ